MFGGLGGGLFDKLKAMVEPNDVGGSKPPAPKQEVSVAVYLTVGGNVFSSAWIETIVAISGGRAQRLACKHAQFACDPDPSFVCIRS